jgi:taurine dehydrogenase small subunit
MYGRRLGAGTIHRAARRRHTDVSGIDGMPEPRRFSPRGVTMMTTKDLDTFFEAGWNAHDVDLLMTFMSDDCVFESIAGPDACGTRHVGRERVRAAFAGVFAAFPDVHFGAARHFVSGDRGLSEWIFTGTTGDGRKVEVNGCDVFTFRHDKIAVKSSFFKNRTAS